MENRWYRRRNCNSPDINDECQNNAGDANPHLLEVVGDYLFFGANDGEMARVMEE